MGGPIARMTNRECTKSGAQCSGTLTTDLKTSVPHPNTFTASVNRLPPQDIRTCVKASRKVAGMRSCSTGFSCPVQRSSRSAQALCAAMRTCVGHSLQVQSYQHRSQSSWRNTSRTVCTVCHGVAMPDLCKLPPFHLVPGWP